MKFWALSAIPHSYIVLEYSNQNFELCSKYSNQNILICIVIIQTLYIIGRAENDNFKDKLEAQQIEMTQAKVTQWQLAEPD